MFFNKVNTKNTTKDEVEPYPDGLLDRLDLVGLTEIKKNGVTLFYDASTDRSYKIQIDIKKLGTSQNTDAIIITRIPVGEGRFSKA